MEKEITDINEPMSFPVDEAADKPRTFHVPAGSYALTAWSVERGLSKNGDPKLNIKFGINGQKCGKWLFHNLTLLPKDNAGHGIAVHGLKALGFAIDKSMVNFRPADIIGRVCRAELIVEEKDHVADSGTHYTRYSNKIKSIAYALPDDKPEMPAPAPMPSPMDGNDVPF
jgi:hypothetical protein